MYFNVENTYTASFASSGRVRRGPIDVGADLEGNVLQGALTSNVTTVSIMVIGLFLKIKYECENAYEQKFGLDDSFRNRTATHIIHTCTNVCIWVPVFNRESLPNCTVLLERESPFRTVSRRVDRKFQQRIRVALSMRFSPRKLRVEHWKKLYLIVHKSSLYIRACACVLARVGGATYETLFTVRQSHCFKKMALRKKKSSSYCKTVSQSRFRCTFRISNHNHATNNNK